MQSRLYDSAARENVFISTSTSNPFPVSRPTSHEAKKSQFHTITQTSTFQPGSYQVTGSPSLIRPASQHRFQPGISSGPHLIRTSSLSPSSGKNVGILRNSRSGSPITTTTIGQPIPGPIMVSPAMIGSPLTSTPIVSRITVGVPPSPTQIVHQMPIHNITRTQVIKQSVTDQKQINRLQVANQTLIENYTNLYTKFKDLQNNSGRQLVTSTGSVNEVQLVRSLRGRIQQICDFQLETALSRLRSAAPRTAHFYNRSSPMN